MGTARRAFKYHMLACHRKALPSSLCCSNAWLAACHADLKAGTAKLHTLYQHVLTQGPPRMQCCGVAWQRCPQSRTRPCCDRPSTASTGCAACSSPWCPVWTTLAHKLRTPSCHGRLLVLPLLKLVLTVAHLQVIRLDKNDIDAQWDQAILLTEIKETRKVGSSGSARTLAVLHKACWQGPADLAAKDATG